MPKSPMEQLREATRKREQLRKDWDKQRNVDLLSLLQVAIPVMFKCERFSLFVRDGYTDSLWVGAGTGVTERAIVVNEADSMLGEAIKQRRPVIREHLQQQAGAHAQVAHRVGFQANNALTVPVFDPDDGLAIGALQVLNKESQQTWSQEEALLLQEIAHCISGSVSMMQQNQDLLNKARYLDAEIAHLTKKESAIRGGHMFRTFEPSVELESGGFLHTRYQGTMFPPFIDVQATQDLADSWDTGPNDIFICSHQKVGTHLLKQYIVEILRQCGDLPANNIYKDGDIGVDVVPWPSVMYSQHGRASWERHIANTHNQPRVWYIHSSYADLPIRRIHPETKFIMVYRDPRSVAVSQYFFYKRHPLLRVSDSLEMDAFIEKFLDGDLYFGDYHHHVKGWIHRKDSRISDTQLLVLSYEDLVQQKMECGRVLSEFLIGRVDEERLVDVVASTEFDAMKKAISDNPQSFHLNPKVYFRSGTTNDWQQHLSLLAQFAINAKTKEIWGENANFSVLKS